MRTLGGRVTLALLSGLMLALSFPLSLLPLPTWLAAQLNFNLPSSPALGPLPVPLPNLLMPQQPVDGYVQIHWLAFFALIPLLLAIRAALRPLEAFGLGLLCALGWNFLSLMWFSSFGAAPVFLMSFYYALPIGLFGLLAWWLLNGPAPATRSAALCMVFGPPLVWTALEYLRSFGFWAFPWLLLGYSQARHPLLLQTADLGGVFAVSFLIVLVNTALFALLKSPVPLRLRMGQIARAALLLLAALCYGFWRLHSIPAPGEASQFAAPSIGSMPSLAQSLGKQEELHVALVQGGISSLEKWTPETEEKSVEAYVSPSLQALKVWNGEAAAALSSQHGISSFPIAPAAGPQLPQSIPPAAKEAEAAAPPVSNAPAKDFVGPLQVSVLPETKLQQPALTERPAPKKDKGELLFVWPEGAIEAPYQIDPRHMYQVPSRVRSLVRNKTGAALLFGAIGSPHNDQTVENGCMLLDSEGNGVWPYSKIHLVPFGETVPFREVVRFLDYPWSGGDLTEGRKREPFIWRGHTMGALICYDNVFGFIPREQTRRGAQYIFLMTNNSWYTLRSGIRQHCDIDVLRAVECRRPLGRASTTGWSQAVDPAGRILAQTMAGGAGLIQISLPPGPPPGLTPAWLKEKPGAKTQRSQQRSIIPRLGASAGEALLALAGKDKAADAEAKKVAAREAAEADEREASRAEADAAAGKAAGTKGQLSSEESPAQQKAVSKKGEPKRLRGKPDASRRHSPASRGHFKPRSSGRELISDSPYLILGDLFAQLCIVFSALLCLPPIIRGRSEGWL